MDWALADDATVRSGVAVTGISRDLEAQVLAAAG
jgi:hypothetical protein